MNELEKELFYLAKFAKRTPRHRILISADRLFALATKAHGYVPEPPSWTQPPPNNQLRDRQRP